MYYHHTSYGWGPPMSTSFWLFFSTPFCSHSFKKWKQNDKKQNASYHHKVHCLYLWSEIIQSLCYVKKIKFCHLAHSLPTYVHLEKQISHQQCHSSSVSEASFSTDSDICNSYGKGALLRWFSSQNALPVDCYHHNLVSRVHENKSKQKRHTKSLHSYNVPCLHL